MDQLITAIKEWPVIFQGALGSGLFSFFLWLAAWARKHISLSYSRHSVSSRKTWLLNQIAKYQLLDATDGLPRIESALLVFYRASRPFLKALMWLVFGLIMSSMIDSAGIVAYLVCLSYLFKAFEVVAPKDDDVMPKDKLKQLNDELSSLNNK